MAKVHLTPRLVETLQVEGGRERTVYLDTSRDAPRGFALRVTARGARAFYLLATSKRYGRRWVHIGDALALSLKDARKTALLRAGEIARGADPTGDARAARAQALAEKINAQAGSDEWTVARLVEEYIKVRPLAPETRRSYHSKLRGHIAKGLLGFMPAREVVKDDVRRFLAPLARKTPAQTGRILFLLRASFRWGQDEEVLVATPDGRRVARPRVDRDPTRRLEHELPTVRAAVGRRRERHLSDEELPLFWLGLDSLPLAWATYARIILLNGTRKWETYAARWPCLDIDGATANWHVPAEDRKGRMAGLPGERRPLDIPIAPLSVQLLKELREVTARAPGAPARWREYVFRCQGFSLGHVAAAVKRETGLADLNLHAIRHSCGSGLQRLGAPPHVISVVLGHTREEGATEADAVYMHDRRFKEHRLWLARWARHVEQLVRRKQGQRAEVIPLVSRGQLSQPAGGRTRPPGPRPAKDWSPPSGAAGSSSGGGSMWPPCGPPSSGCRIRPTAGRSSTGVPWSPCRRRPGRARSARVPAAAGRAAPARAHASACGCAAAPTARRAARSALATDEWDATCNRCGTRYERPEGV